jgi:hypothetical protein
MKQKRHTMVQVMAKLRRADIELGQGKNLADFCRLLEVNV